jgi:fatty-acyl-CoA synthase
MGEIMITKTVNQLIEEKASIMRDYPIIIDGDETVTYGNLYGMINKVSNSLLYLNIQEGDRVLLIGYNSVRWLYVFFAVMNINAIPIPVNAENGTEELINILMDTRPRAIFFSSKYKNNDLLAVVTSSIINSSNKDIYCVLFEDLDENDTFINWSQFLATRTTNKQNKSKNGLYCIQYTSGSTGLPKGVMLSQYAVLNNGFHTGEALHLDKSDKMCLAVPLFHCFGNVLALLSCLTHDTQIVLVDYYSPRKTYNIIAEKKCTVFFGVPTMYILMMGLPAFDKEKIASLKKGVVAGATVPEQLMKKIATAFSIPYLISGYGMTETSPGCTISDIYLPEIIRFNSVGTAFPGVDIKIIDLHSGAEVEDNEIGELIVKGYNLMEGYYNYSETIIDGNGWLHTGDLAVVSNGYYRIVGRRKDVIIKGGENIAPLEIENILCTHKLIKDAVVVGIEDDLYGEEVAAALIVEDEISDTEIITLLQGKLAKFKIPKYFVRFKEFPCSASGKVLRGVVKELCRQSLSI